MDENELSTFKLMQFVADTHQNIDSMKNIEHSLDSIIKRLKDHDNINLYDAELRKKLENDVIDLKRAVNKLTQGIAVIGNKYNEQTLSNKYLNGKLEDTISSFKNIQASVDEIKKMATDNSYDIASLQKDNNQRDAMLSDISEKLDASNEKWKDLEIKAKVGIGIFVTLYLIIEKLDVLRNFLLK